MSVVNNTLFDDKLKELKRIEKELQEEKNAVHIVLGEWLANALDDKDNKDLIELFISKHADKKYLTLKRQRETAKKVADNLKTLNKTAESKHAENVADEDKKAEKISTNNDINKNQNTAPKDNNGGGLLSGINR